MKLTILTTLLTVSLATTAFCTEATLPSSPQPTPHPATSAPSPPSSLSTPNVSVSQTTTPPAATPAKSSSLLDAQPLTYGPLATTAPIKLGYVDIQKIFQESRTGLKAVESLKKSRDKFQKQLTEKGKKLETLKKSLEAKAQQMNPLERESKSKEFQGKVNEFQESGQKAEKEIAKQADDVRRKLQEQVSKLIRGYGEKNGYTLIAVDLLYSDGNHKLTDITGDIIKELDK